MILLTTGQLVCGKGVTSIDPAPKAGVCLGRAVFADLIKVVEDILLVETWRWPLCIVATGAKHEASRPEGSNTFANIYLGEADWVWAVGSEIVWASFDLLVIWPRLRSGAKVGSNTLLSLNLERISILIVIRNNFVKNLPMWRPLESQIQQQEMPKWLTGVCWKASFFCGSRSKSQRLLYCRVKCCWLKTGIFFIPSWWLLYVDERHCIRKSSGP